MYSSSTATARPAEQRRLHTDEANEEKKKKNVSTDRDGNAKKEKRKINRTKKSSRTDFKFEFIIQ